MSKDHARIYSKHTKNNVKLLGTTIAIVRKKQKLSETTATVKINISRSTMQCLKKGDLKVGIGLYFEAAWAVGVKILVPNDESLKQQELNDY